MEAKLLRESIRKIDFYSNRIARDSADSIIRMENDVAELREKAKNTDNMSLRLSHESTANHIDECRTAVIAMILSSAAQVNEEHEVVQDELRILSVSSTSRDVAMSIERCLEFSKKMKPAEGKVDKRTRRKRILTGVKWIAAGLIIGAINTAIVLWIGLSLL